MRCLIIGLDGADFDLIRPWIEGSSLPFLNGLVQNGCRGRLKTVFPPITAPAWSSFLTGKNPGKHGIYDFLYEEKRLHTSRPNSRLTRKVEDFYHILNRHGISTGLINVPMTYPPGPVDGYMITGIMTPRGRAARKVRYTYPEALQEELLKEVGSYTIHPRGAYRKGNARMIYDELIGDLRIKARAVYHLFQNRPTDLAMLVIGGTDKIQHDLYHLIDENHPLYDPKEAREDGHLIKDYFIQVDREIGRIVEKFCDDETLIIVMSDHGMGPLHKWILLNVWLLREGYLVLKKDPLVRIRKILFDSGITPVNIYKLLLRLGFSKAGVSYERRDRIINRYFLSWKDVDWEKTRAYSWGQVGQIFLNRRKGAAGPDGKNDYVGLREEISSKLVKLKDGDSTLFNRVLPASGYYLGPSAGEGADLIVEPGSYKYIGLGTSAFLSNKFLERCFGSMSSHRMEGIFMARGPGIRKNREISGASIMDVVPTLLFHLGIPIDPDMDGRVIEDLYENGFSASRKPAFRKKEDVTPMDERETGDVYTDSESELVKKRLRDLGYFS